MDNSTKKLLEECSVGCKMGIESMEQVPAPCNRRRDRRCDREILFQTQRTGGRSLQNVPACRSAGERTGSHGLHILLDDHRRQNDDRRRRKQTGSQNHHERMQHGNPVHHRSPAPMQRCILRKHLRSKETYQNGRESAG